MMSSISDKPNIKGKNKHDILGCIFDDSRPLFFILEPVLSDHASTALKVTNNFPGSVNGLIIFLQHELSMYAEPNLLLRNPFC